MKKKKLKEIIALLQAENNDLRERVAEMGGFDPYENSRSELIFETHQKIVYRGWTPEEVIDHLFREESLLWERSS